MTKRGWGSVGIVVVLAAMVGVGCSSGSKVRSDSGPAVESSTTTKAGEEKESTTTVADASPATSSALAISGTVTIPDGEAGKLSIVLTGKPEAQRGTVPVVVRNRTSDSVYSIEVNGTARSADGALVGSGSSQGVTPSEVGPGEWAFGYVYFDSDLPTDASFDLTATGSTDSGFLASVDGTIAEYNVAPGSYGTDVIGIVSNDTDAEISGPVSVDLMCFDGAGTAPVSTSGSYTDGDSIPAGGTSSFSLSLPDNCANFALGASGYST